VQTWDVIVVGGGIIGLSLSLALRKRGLKVLVVDRSEPGHEASSAAAGMLADCMLETPRVLQPLASASARMYPEFVHELQDESGEDVDLRDQGTIIFPTPGYVCERAPFDVECLLPQPLSELEPGLADGLGLALFLRERSVDPRALVSAALKAAKHRGVDISSGTTVTDLLFAQGRVAGVKTDQTIYPSGAVVNCAGAWAGQLFHFPIPARPVKGQMLCVIDASHHLLRHVIRSSEVYLVPRSDGRIVIGATVEDAGFDKRTDPDTIRRLHQAAVRLLPGLKHTIMHDAWAGLRPGTPDDLPILGTTDTPGYFIATGHYRDGILLAPITAHLMAQLVTGQPTNYNLSAFNPSRFVALKRA
jgi:glycine oxidase